MEKLLIIDDSDEIRNQMKWGLAKEYEVVLARDADDGLAQFRKHEPAVVTLDLGLPPHENSTEEGFRCLEQILSGTPCAKVIVITGQDGRDNALQAIQMGAYDFYQKPIELSELKVTIRRAFYLHSLEAENIRLQSSLGQPGDVFAGIVGQCPEMNNVFSTIRKVASSDVSVLVMGESGTGKELVAWAIHSLSARKEGAFIPINCGAIPENLMESELFGYEKGAFTGAHARVQGKVEFANNGTLFLDEIAELPPALQVKLLRFLQERMIQRVGGREDIPVDARIVAATNVDITKAMEVGAFREDLYYRIGVITINLPPLRKRGDDILLLANLFLQRSCREFGKKVKGFSKGTIDVIARYSWPGNVRELENRVQRGVLMAEHALLEPSDLGFSQDKEMKSVRMREVTTLREAREMVERDLLTQSMERSGGNIAKAAEELGVSRPTFYDLMKKHGVSAGH